MLHEPIASEAITLSQLATYDKASTVTFALCCYLEPKSETCLKGTALSCLSPSAALQFSRWGICSVQPMGYLLSSADGVFAHKRVVA